MYQNPNVKSATTAGLLGIFLGAFGAHNWYLGEKNKGIAHVCMMSGGIILEILAGAILPNVMSWSMLIQMAWVFTILTAIASLAMGASGIWGLVEGITILTQGDAGLARKGYAVATPMMAPQQGYGPQPMNNQPMNNYNQPMGGYPGQPQPMNGYYNNQPPMNPMNGYNTPMGGQPNGNMDKMNNMNNMGNMNGDQNNNGINGDNFNVQ